MTDTTTKTKATLTWQETLEKSAGLQARGDKARKTASALLWVGAKAGIADFIERTDDDPTAEVLYQEVLSLLGTGRKGDASKIRTVAVAVATNGLVVDDYDNLSKAYAEATRLTKTIKTQAIEDEAAEALTTVIAESAPATTKTPEGAASILLAKGVDEASRLLVAQILETAGDYDKAEPVLRAFLRSLSQEINGVKPKPEPKPKAEPKPKPKTTKAKAAPKSGAAKPKPKPAAKPVEAEVEEPVEVDEPTPETDDEDLFPDDLTPEAEEAEVEEAPATKKKPTPVVRRR